MDYEAIESDKELWQGYEAWLDEQADLYEYQTMIEHSSDQVFGVSL